MSPILASTNPDLRSFRAEGGKLIQYHGWGDAAISPLSSIEYFETVKSFLEKYPDARRNAPSPVNDFYRLFMVPGMGHCGGGTGPNNFDAFAALEQWVEKNTAPDKIIGSGSVAGDASKTLTRPLCVYPQTARYKGTGDINNAANFVCASASR
jgi:feruloyl esterase